MNSQTQPPVCQNGGMCCNGAGNVCQENVGPHKAEVAKTEKSVDLKEHNFTILAFRVFFFPQNSNQKQKAKSPVKCG